MIGAFLLGGCLLAGAAHAATLRIGMHLERDLGFGVTDPNDAVDVIAELGPPAGSGSGVELAEVTLFQVVFSQRVGTLNTRGQSLSLQSATLTPGVRGVHAAFEGGTFRNFQTFFLGGPLSNVPLEPSVSFNKELFFLGLLDLDRTRFTDTVEFCSSCNAVYHQVGEETLSVIPLPASGVLLAAAIAGVVAGYGRRGARPH